MKILAVYIAEESVLNRFNRTMLAQSEIWPWKGIDRLLVTDPSSEMGVDWPTVRILLKQDRHFLFAHAKNAGLRYAAAHGYDWLIDMDADTILLGPPHEFPRTGYGCVPCHFLPRNAGISAARMVSNSTSADFQGSSRFLLHRDVFMKHFYHEKFWGYGGEDLDYHENILGRAGIHQSKTDARCVHFWHENGPREGNLELFHERRHDERE